MFNPEPEPDGNRTDNLNHLKRALYYHDQHKKVKVLFHGELRLDSEKAPLTQLVTFDSDLEFLDSCPKIDMQKKTELGVLNAFLDPLFKDYSCFKNELITLRHEERQTLTRR